MLQQHMESHKHSLPVSFQLGKKCKRVEIWVTKYPWALDEMVESGHTSKPPGFQSISGACEDLIHCEMKTLLTQWD